MKVFCSLALVILTICWTADPVAAGDCVNQVPVMTSNTSPSGTVTTSGIFSSTYDAWKAFDDPAPNSHWISAVGETPAWIAYDWGSSRTIDQYSLHFRNGTLTGRAPKDWTFEGWDGFSWVVLDSRTGETGWPSGETRSYTVASPGGYGKVRLLITDDNDIRTGVEVISLHVITFESCLPIFSDGFESGDLLDWSSTGSEP